MVDLVWVLVEARVEVSIFFFLNICVFSKYVTAVKLSIVGVCRNLDRVLNLKLKSVRKSAKVSGISEGGDGAGIYFFS